MGLSSVKVEERGWEGGLIFREALPSQVVDTPFALFVCCNLRGIFEVSICLNGFGANETFPLGDQNKQSQVRKLWDDIWKNYVMRTNSGRYYKENYKRSKGFYGGYSADTKKENRLTYFVPIFHLYTP